MNITIVGGGVLAFFISRSLGEKGHRVTVINRDPAECTQLARRLKATVVSGNATHPAVLEDAGVRQQHAVIAITSHDEDNLLICQLASGMFGVRRVLAMVNDPRSEELFHKLGVPETFSVTTILSSLIEQRASFDSIINLFPAANGSLEVVEVLVPDEAPCVGRTLSSLALPASTLIAAISRGKDEIVPNGKTTLAAGDRMLVVTRHDSFAEVMAYLTGGIEWAVRQPVRK